MTLTELIQHRDAVRAIVADASIAISDKKQIVTEAIQALRSHAISTATKFRSLVAVELKQLLDSLERDTDGNLRQGGSAGQYAGASDRSRDLRPERDAEVTKAKKGKSNR